MLISAPIPGTQNYMFLGMGIRILFIKLLGVSLRFWFKRNEKNITINNNFQAGRNNTLSIIHYERVVIDNRITITLGFNLLNFTGERRRIWTDRADGWDQWLLSEDG
jgi:hypothetical protein